MQQVTLTARPKRWDEPFGSRLTNEELTQLQQISKIAAIDATRFPAKLPLAEILRNDTRIVYYQAGEVVVREGEYGNSAFLVLSGTLHRVLSPGLPPESLGRQHSQKSILKTLFANLKQHSKYPETRNLKRYTEKESKSKTTVGMQAGEAIPGHSTIIGTGTARAEIRSHEDTVKLILHDVSEIIRTHRTLRLKRGDLFGEVSVFERGTRNATVFTETDAMLLEIRWQGLRDICKYDKDWRLRIEEQYRKRALINHLQASLLFHGLDASVLQKIADQTLFENYGEFEWGTQFKRFREVETEHPNVESVIAHEGEHPNGILLIAAGFARVWTTLGSGRRTLTYLRVGDVFGLDEAYASWQTGNIVPLETSLSALGYVNVLRIPANLLEQWVFGDQLPAIKRLAKIGTRPMEQDGLLEWAVDEHFINGTQAMLIDLDRCVRCDDCVRACGSTHRGNPRFIRHGKVFDHWMVANACMHCVDPVCMVGCPTGAIHRSIRGGMVVINDATCIGCQTCANACPYDNIRMVEVRDKKGHAHFDPDTQMPILKATKCDLCSGLPGGPACVRACPHEALQRVDFRDSSLITRGL